MTFVWIIVGLIAAIALVYVMLERQRKPISKAERNAAPGEFAKLSQGQTYYQWHGSVRGPVLVAIHGLTTPSIAYQLMAVGLGSMGYRVMTYDLYGRGLSDAPEGPQDKAFFLRQLSDLLEDQGLTEDVTLVGYSMGGAIASAFAAAHIHLVKRLILVAPSGIEMRESKFSAFCRKTPLIGDFIHNLIGGFRMTNAIRADKAVSEVPDIKTAQLAEVKRRGFLKAVLASCRGMLDEVQKGEHQAIGRADIPTIAIWAERDEVIPISAVGTLAQWNRNVRQETIPDAGHGLPFTHTTALLEKLRDITIER